MNMDLGCLDLGCISLADENKTLNSSVESSIDSLSSTAKLSKIKSPKDSPPSGGNALNRVTSQIKKPPHRKASPLNWFPRKKMDSYLKRKIKLLQEAGGMNDTLDETLGHSNPHYCRVEREKRAAREAACKVMEARKAAMVEASWCRILQAARIPNKEADAQLLKAEKEVAEAFEAAKAKGVIMYDTPDRPWKDFEIEISSASVKGSTTHTVKASFETAFEVDKQVAAGVKTAFVRLAHCHSFDKDEFKDLLRKIRENPDSQELSESSEFDTLSEFNTGSLDDGSNSHKKNRKKQSPQKFKGTNLVIMMLERLKRLKEEELSSLATIVATCGLNAALAETAKSSSKDYYYMNGARQKHVEPELPSLDKFLVKKMTKLEKEVQDAKNARKAESEVGCNVQDDKPVEPELPSLDKFLIKKLTKLEKEVQDAKKARNTEWPQSERNGNVSVENVPDLGSVLVKHPSKLEKELDEEKRSQKSDINGRSRKLKQVETEVPSLDKFLVKHVSRLEKEVQEAKNRRNNEFHVILEGGDFGQEQIQKENINSNTVQMERDSQNAEKENLYRVLIKHVSRLEKEKMGLGFKEEVLEIKKRDKAVTQMDSNAGGLEEILVKHKSRLERERERELLQTGGLDEILVKQTSRLERDLLQTGGLDEILVKQKSRLERERSVVASEEQPEARNTYSKSRREARERELLQTWGGIGLGNSMRPHVSRLERDKAAWIKAEEEEKLTAVIEN